MKKNKIELSIALPMYRSENIAWLVFESLARQKDIDFSWELLVAEETEQAFGPDSIKKYADRLQQIGCNRIEYYSLNSWVPLSQKWHHLAGKSSNTNCFLLAAADVYYQPYRLKETLDIFNENTPDWVQSSKGYFYEIKDERLALFDSKRNNYNHPCALNMAIKTELIKKIEINHKRSSVDSYLYRNMENKKGGPLHIEYNESENWRKGVATHGLNNISLDRGPMMEEYVKPFYKPDINEIENILPADICEKLKMCKDKTYKNAWVF